ncbi:hypothetical protein AUQ37_07615 [Candidatus Methanomethylophilus sp. 1R26]|uniref:class I SAM-dependent methyltransferase n=1 Tax=Candidatus Methanomethylophilus sp. 1R26 TaxID=1769296 RepID=UPI000736FA1B|nr:class I SAM-dependent methyltransferase [Candidatus Methanomethylophilus sp. 1R26]KUE73752.1 hypothetical protein AUQ37_07615 [Candidatus Methanomethylophilus sp. 1R26]
MESRSEIVDRIRAGYDVAAPKISDFAEEHRAREESSLYYCRLRELCRGKHLKALEIGVGGGFLSIFLARLGCEMTAVDNSDGILAQARRNFAEAGADIDLRKIEDAQDLDFPEGTFDLIVSRKVTWHFTEPRKAYASWMKALRPGGTMMSSTGTIISNSTTRTTCSRSSRTRITSTGATGTPSTPTRRASAGNCT